MSFKLACITAKCPGNMEIIRHQENGLLVDYGDIDMLSSSIVRVLLDHNLSRALGLHAFYTVQKQFSIEKSARSYREFYTTMLGNRVSSPG